jgi:tellurite resistance protein
LEEIDEMFTARLPARKFRKYVCTGQAAIESKLRDVRQSEEKDEEVKGETAETIERVYGDKRAVAGVVETAMNVA